MKANDEILDHVEANSKYDVNHRHEREPLLPYTVGGGNSPRGDGETHRTIVYAYTLTLLSTVAFSASSFLVHLAETRLATSFMWTMLLRGAVQTLLSLAYLAVSPSFRSALPTLTSSQLICVSIRSVAGAVSIAALYAAVQLAPVGNSVAIYSSNPALSVLLAVAILREKVARIQAAAAIAAAIGAILVALPSGIVSAQGHPPFITNLAQNIERNHAIGAGLAALAALLAAVSLTALRKLSISAHFMVAVLAFGLTTLFCCLPIVVIRPSVVSGATTFGIVTAVIAAVTGFVGQCCMSRALRDCPVAPAAVLLNMEVPISFLMGLFFMGELPNTSQMVGSLIIFLSIVFMRVKS